MNSDERSRKEIRGEIDEESGRDNKLNCLVDISILDGSGWRMANAERALNIYLSFSH